MNTDEINALASRIYEQNRAIGWWDNPDRCVFETIQLVSSEIAEATEGERKGVNDAHLPDRPMGEVELADAVIRLLDMGGAYGWVYDEDLAEAERGFQQMGVNSALGYHFVCNMALSGLGACIAFADDPRGRNDLTVSSMYSLAIDTLRAAAVRLGYDLWGALEEKLEYNKHRPDHKRENRAKEGGKKL